MPHSLSDEGTTAGPIHAAREAYLMQLHQVLEVYGEVQSSLTSFETASDSATQAIFQARNTLASHVTDTRIATTIGAGVSLVGGILSFTPLAAVGIPLAAVGGAVASGSMVVSSVHDAEATKAFAESLGGYKKAAKALKLSLYKTSDVQRKLVRAFAKFWAVLHDEPLPELSEEALAARSKGRYIEVPITSWELPTGKFAHDQYPNCSKETVLTSLATSVGRLSHGIPAIGVAFDIVEIVTTWTSSNETVTKADALLEEIRRQRECDRSNVAAQLAKLEDLARQDLLRKAISPLCGGALPPLDTGAPVTASSMLDQMQDNVYVPFVIFADERADGTYGTFLLREDELKQLNRLPMAAPVVERLFEEYPTLNAAHDEGAEANAYGKPQTSSTARDLLSRTDLQRFSLRCSFTELGDEEIRAVPSMAQYVDDNAGQTTPSWMRYWQWWFASAIAAQAVAQVCYVKSESTDGAPWTAQHATKHDLDSVTGVCVVRRVGREGMPCWHIAPMCQSHVCAGAEVEGKLREKLMMTRSTAWAIEIPRI